MGDDANRTAQSTDPMSGDFYAHAAEWYAASSHPVLTQQTEALTTLLAGQEPRRVAVDIGAGIGATLLGLQRAGVERIHAVEPSPAMRIGLYTHVALTPALTGITTVQAGTVHEVEDQLPDTWDVVTLLNVLGHLSVSEEEALWRLFSERLAPGGRLIVGLQPPSTPIPVPVTEFDTAVVGEHSWTVSGFAEAVDEAHVKWTMRRTLRGPEGNVLQCTSGTSLWRTCSAEQLTDRAVAAGFTADRRDEALGLYTFLRALP